MSIDDVDREMRMQSRLDALMVQWGIDNGDSHFELRYDGCSDHAWKVHHSWFDGSHDAAEDTSTRETGAEAWEQFFGETVAHAVEAAWEHHGRFVLCPACGGDGDFRHHYEPGEIVGPLADGESKQTHHDSSVTVSKICAGCHGERLVKS